MLEKNAQGVAKWDAIRAALEGFFVDPQSKGMGAGIQYFPLVNPNAPNSCTKQEDCGAEFGPCDLRECLSAPTVCVTNADCGAAGPCVDRGACADDPTQACKPANAQCAGGKGLCTKLTTSVCLNTDSCEADQYATPAVEIASLDVSAVDLVASMTGAVPAGRTPTAAALQGVIDHAGEWALANPTHKVVAVLATDGRPTQCDPTDGPGLLALAQTGLTGFPSITTFVIGVLAPNDSLGKSIMNQIAYGGGTQQAFLIDPATDVKQAFLDALKAIRSSQLACEYLVPAPPDGQKLDYDEVNVQYTPNSGGPANTVGYVGAEASCDPVKGGWYYDADPATGSTPTKILVCPATCALFDKAADVSIALGCKTVHE